VEWSDGATAGGITFRTAAPANHGQRGDGDPRDEAPSALRPPLLLIHGLAGGAWYWERFQRVFAARGYVSHALNLRGHHDSRPAPRLGAVSLRDYVEDVAEVAAMLGRPVVIGHSMGGLLAQALMEADAVRAAVLLCPMPPRGIGFATPALAFRQLRHLPAMLFQRPLVGSAEDMIATSLNRVPAAEQRMLAARFVPESGRVARELSLGGLDIDPARARVPTLVVSASDDRFFSPAVGARVAARYGADHRVYEEHAHFLVEEPGAEEIAGDVAAWITARAVIGR